jgi:hypothetical protein
MVKAKANHYAITYGYLVRDQTAQKAVTKLQGYLDHNKVPSTARKRAHVATPREIEFFEQQNLKIIE